MASRRWRHTMLLITSPTLVQVSAFSGISSGSTDNSSKFFSEARADVLNLLNHPLQLQLATGELPLGSFRRLVSDRAVILEGLQSATPPGLLDDEISRHDDDSRQWLEAAEACGKTIIAPGIKCFNCGGEHLNIDCPDDAETSPSAMALRSVLESHGLPGAAAVLRSYSFACARLLEAVDRCGATFVDDRAYRGWLEAHAVRWTNMADECEVELDESESGAAAASPSYTICLSMFYNWIDSEAATTGVRSEGGGGEDDSMWERIRDTIEELEPGYAAQRDKHQSFVADITGTKDAKAKMDAAERKVNAAAAYLAAKKKKQSKY